MLKPVTKKDLDKWEKDLDDTNMHCYVPEEKLALLFDDGTSKLILEQGSLNKDNISYLNQKSAVVIRSLNNAYIWAQILQKADFHGSIAVELGSGTSPVLDIALALIGFGGILIKADYSKWEETNEKALRRSYKIELLAIDITKQTDEIPGTDSLAMNHFWDDLYMGLWATDSGVDYFGYAINKPEENNKCWAQAIIQKNKYIPKIKELIKQLAQKVHPGGLVVIRNYPSGFETNFRQVARVNFTFELTNLVAELFKETGLEELSINLDDIAGPLGSKYPGSLFAFKKP